MDRRGDWMANGPSFSNGPHCPRDWRLRELLEVQVSFWALV